MSPPRYIFRRQRKWYSSPLYIFVLTGLILSGLFITQGFRRQEIKPLFMPTPTPTRIASSFMQEAETHFAAGNLDAAVASYQEAISINPDNGRLYAEMARILTYSTESQTTEKDKQARFDQALEASKKAIELAPEDSTAFAVRAFTLDWYASFVKYIQKDEVSSAKLLTEADQAASKAITLDETNVLAQVYRAEIMIDQQNYTQIQDVIRSALSRQPNLWDAHRVNGLYLESQGYYTDAVNEFEQAVKLAPNMTFLYIKLGMSYRSMGLKTNDEVAYKQAMVYFEMAANKNEQQGIKDAQPYLGIGRTYGQLGEFFAAARNMNKALQYDPANPEVYAQLGMVFRQARNYEDAIKALKCSVRGCTSEESCYLRQCNPDTDPAITITGMPLNGLTVVYYYTYASLMAGMYLPRDPTRSTYCTDSTAIIQQIRASSFGNDPTIGGILNESESICRTMLTVPTQGVAPTPTATGRPPATPLPARKPSPTPTPKPRTGG